MNDFTRAHHTCGSWVERANAAANPVARTWAARHRCAWLGLSGAAGAPASGTDPAGGRGGEGASAPATRGARPGVGPIGCAGLVPRGGPGAPASGTDPAGEPGFAP